MCLCAFGPVQEPLCSLLESLLRLTLLSYSARWDLKEREKKNLSTSTVGVAAVVRLPHHQTFSCYRWRVSSSFFNLIIVFYYLFDWYWRVSGSAKAWRIINNNSNSKSISERKRSRSSTRSLDHSFTIDASGRQEPTAQVNHSLPFYLLDRRKKSKTKNKERSNQLIEKKGSDSM